MEWLLPSLATAGLFGGVLWLFRNLILTRLTNAVKHEYDEKLEGIKASIRLNEEYIKAEIQAKEREIEALRSGALSMITTTQSRLYERQVKGVEDLWNAVIALAPAKSVSASMAMLNLDEIVKKAPYEPKYMQFFKDLPQFDQKTLQTIRPEASRPFVSPLAWAMYSAYQSILIYGTLRLKTLQLGLYDDFADIGHIKKIVKAALPHRSDFIDRHDPKSFFYLLEELEEFLLLELKSILDGNKSDAESIARAASIIKEVSRLSEKQDG